MAVKEKILWDSDPFLWSCKEAELSQMAKLRAVDDKIRSWLYGVSKEEGGIHHWGISRGYWENIREGFDEHRVTDLGTKEKIYDIVHYLSHLLKH